MRAPSPILSILSLTALLGVLSSGCTPKITAAELDGDVEEGDGLDGNTEDSGGAEDSGAAEDTAAEEDLEQWAGATLEIRSPASGAFLPYGEPADFEAIIVGADGVELPFDGVAWESSIDDWTATGASFEDAGLDVGTHTLSAEAVLPDGTRLVSQVAGVQVQSEATGTYVGNLIVDLTGEYNGTPITASCIGAAIVYVDLRGERVAGDSTCVLSFFGFDTEARHEFDLGIDGDEVAGTADLDLSFFALTFDATGGIDDETISAGWTGDVGGLLTVTGDLSIDRISRDVGE
ncbi:MAG: hypothetical protein RL071_4199 [Pseudomonadota bacterium]